MDNLLFYLFSFYIYYIWLSKNVFFKDSDEEFEEMLKEAETAMGDEDVQITAETKKKVKEKILLNCNSGLWKGNVGIEREVLQ